MHFISSLSCACVSIFSPRQAGRVKRPRPGEPWTVRELRWNRCQPRNERKVPVESGCFAALKDKENPRRGILVISRRFAPQTLRPRAVYLHNPVKIASTSRRGASSFTRTRRSIIDRVTHARSVPGWDETFTISRRKHARRIFSPALAPPVLPRTRQLFYRCGGEISRYGRWDNGWHKLKFRPIHAKTGELRTELSDLRPATVRVAMRAARTSVLWLICRPWSYLSRERTLAAFSDARQIFLN